MASPPPRSTGDTGTWVGMDRRSRRARILMMPSDMAGLALSARLSDAPVRHSTRTATVDATTVASRGAGSRTASSPMQRARSLDIGDAAVRVQHGHLAVEDDEGFVAGVTGPADLLLLSKPALGARARELGQVLGVEVVEQSNRRQADHLLEDRRSRPPAVPRIVPPGRRNAVSRTTWCSSSSRRRRSASVAWSMESSRYSAVARTYGSGLVSCARSKRGSVGVAPISWRAFASEPARRAPADGDSRAPIADKPPRASARRARSGPPR